MGFIYSIQICEISHQTFGPSHRKCPTCPMFFAYTEIISEVLWHSPAANFTGNAQDIYSWYYIDGLVQERRNSSALAMELHLSCIKPSTCSLKFTTGNSKFQPYLLGTNELIYLHLFQVSMGKWIKLKCGWNQGNQNLLKWSCRHYRRTSRQRRRYYRWKERPVRWGWVKMCIVKCISWLPALKKSHYQCWLIINKVFRKYARYRSENQNYLLPYGSLGPTGNDPYVSRCTGNVPHHWCFYSLEILRWIPRMHVQ